MSKKTEMVPFSFHGDTLQCIPKDGRLWVAVKPVCEALGINADGQRVKLQAKPWAGTETISVPAHGGEQAGVCGFRWSNMTIEQAGRMRQFLEQKRGEVAKQRKRLVKAAPKGGQLKLVVG